MTILLVEDNVELSKALICSLEYAGYEVYAVQNGQEALNVLEIKPIPSLIFLDLMMPVLDGYSFRELKKNNKRLCNIPTLIASAKTDLEKVEKLACEFFLPKPFDLIELLNTLKQIDHQSQIRILDDC